VTLSDNYRDPRSAMTLQTRLSVLFDTASCRKELPPEVRFSGSIPYAIGRRGCVRVPRTRGGEGTGGVYGSPGDRVADHVVRPIRLYGNVIRRAI